MQLRLELSGIGGRRGQGLTGRMGFSRKEEEEEEEDEESHEEDKMRTKGRDEGNWQTNSNMKRRE